MRSYYPWLDLVRFGSALSVAFFHLMFWSWAGDFSAIHRNFFVGATRFPAAVDFTWFGWVGLEVFFVISGFVIANSASKASPVEFLISRALRLYPAVWVCATASFAVMFFLAKDPLSQIVRPYIKSALLIPRGPWIDGVYWTLSAEISFYTLIFFLLVTKRFTLVHSAWLLTIYSATFNAFALLIVVEMVPSSGPYSFLMMHRIPWAILLLYHGCFFAIGIWLFIAANRKLRPHERIGLLIAFLSGTAEVFNTSSFIIASVPAASGQSPLVPVAIWTASVCIIALAARQKMRSSTPAISANFLRTVGLVTYPLYLTHNIVGAAIARLLIAAGLDPTVAVLIALTGLIAICCVFCSTGEPAIRTLLKQFFSKLGLVAGSTITRGAELR